MYLTSDLHFWHHKIIQYENRPFASVEEMNEKMISNINEVVSKRDHLLILGDFAFCGGEKIQELRDAIKCETVDLLLGNHDRHKKPHWWRNKGFREVHAHPIILDRFWMMSHEPLYMNDNMPYVNVHGHTHGTNLSGNFFNVSVEQTDYKPILFDAVKEKFIEKFQ